MNYQASTPKIFPLIDLGDFILREQKDSDVADFFSYYCDPEVNKFILCEIPRDLEEARRELHYWSGVFYRGDGIYFGIATKEDNRLIGSIGLTTYSSYHNRIEISYDLSRHYWNRGIMTKAIAAVVKYGFEQWKVNRMEAFTSTQNEASKHLLLKSGFALEGVLRQHRYHRGAYVDAYSFSFLKEDFAQKNFSFAAK